MAGSHNPPAFPLAVPSDVLIEPAEGMSQRDWFAGQALVGVCQEYLHRNGFHGDTMFSNLACHAYRIADAMLAERKAKP